MTITTIPQADPTGELTNVWRELITTVISCVWDITTAVVGSSVGTIAKAGLYNNDGTIYYRLRDYRLYAMTLETPYDINSFTSNVQVLNAAAQLINTQGVCWANEGMAILITDTLNKVIYQYDLTSAYVVDNSTTYSGYSFSTASQTTGGLRNIEVDDATGKLFACDSGGVGYIHRYTLGANGDLSTPPVYDGLPEAFTYGDVVGLPESAAYAIRFSQDRLVMFLVDIASTVHQIQLVSPANWVGATYDSKAVSLVYAIQDISINPDCSSFVLANSSLNRLYPFNITLS